MHDAAYVVAGYGLTLGTLGWYRWRLSRRAARARRLVAAVSGRATPSREGA